MLNLERDNNRGRERSRERQRQQNHQRDFRQPQRERHRRRYNRPTRPSYQRAERPRQRAWQNNPIFSNRVRYTPPANNRQFLFNRRQQSFERGGGLQLNNRFRIPQQPPRLREIFIPYYAQPSFPAPPIQGCSYPTVQNFPAPIVHQQQPPYFFPRAPPYY